MYRELSPEVPIVAEMYAELGFDVMMGGGDEFFNPEKTISGEKLVQL